MIELALALSFAITIDAAAPWSEYECGKAMLSPDTPIEFTLQADARPRVIIAWQRGIDAKLSATSASGESLTSDLLFNLRGPEIVAIPPTGSSTAIVLQLEHDSTTGWVELCHRTFDISNGIEQVRWRAWNALARALQISEAGQYAADAVDLAARADTLFVSIGAAEAGTWAAYIAAYLTYAHDTDWKGAAELAAAVEERAEAIGNVDIAWAALGLRAAALIEKSRGEPPWVTERNRREALALLDRGILHLLSQDHALEAAWMLNYQGVAYQYLGDMEQAGQRYLEAIRLARAIRSHRIADLITRNYALIQRHRNPLATVALLEGIDLSRYPQSERTHLLYELGQARISAGNWPGALASLHASLESATGIGGLFRARNALAGLYRNLGQMERAAVYVEQNLSESERPSETGAEAQALRIASRIAEDRGDTARATRLLEAAIAAAATKQNALLGRIRLAGARAAGAWTEEALEGLWDEAITLEYPPAQAALVVLALDRGDHSPAWVARGRQLLDLPLSDTTETQIRLSLAKRAAMEDPSVALTILEPVVYRQVSAARSVGLDAAAVRLSRTREDVLRLFVESLLESVEGEADHAEIDRVAQRALQIHLRLVGVERSLGASADLRDLDRFRFTSSQESLAPEVELEQLRRAIEVRSIAASETRAAPLSIALPDEQVAYLVGYRHAYRVVRHPERSEVVRLGEVADLVADVNSVNRLLSDPNSPVDSSLLDSLREQLLLDAYPEHERVVATLDGFFARVPFAVLRPDLTFAMSVPRLGVAEVANQAPGAALIVGDPVMSEALGQWSDRSFPPLPGAAREITEIAKIYDGREPLVLRRASATVPAVIAGFRDASMIHLATHGVVNSIIPQLSGLLLSPAASGDAGTGRDFLSLLEITTQPLRAELVVLSACDSGAGPSGVIGGSETLGAAFLAAGARHAVVNQWRAADQATTFLMTRFHRAISEGAEPAAALRQAQTEVREHGRRWRHPYYWAGWTLLEAVNVGTRSEI